MTNLDHLKTAGAEFVALAESMPDTAWDTPSPCDGWTARDVVDHVRTGCLFAVALLGGASSDEATAARSVLPLDRSLVEACGEAVDLQVAAFSGAGALDLTVQHPVIDMSGAQLLEHRIVDLVVHRWDLGRVVDDAYEIDGELAELALSFMEPLATITGSLGMFGEGPSELDINGASPARRLLDITGRRP